MFFFSFDFLFFSYIIQGKASGNTAKSNLANKGAKKKQNMNRNSANKMEEIRAGSDKDYNLSQLSVSVNTSS